MKKINFKKIISIVLWIIGLSGLLMSLAFATNKEKSVVVENINVTIENTDENAFIDEKDVKDFLKERRGSTYHSEIRDINSNGLEKTLNAHPAVENSEISVDINGDVNIYVTQRKPIVRVFNLNGESYYIDDKAKLMPLNEKYTARVLIATGYIFEPFAQRYSMSINDIANNKSFSDVSVLDDIYAITNYITKDSILTNLIHQINITKEKEIELYPSIGDHKIIFGEATDIETKFNKLKLFYTEGLNKTDGWHKYSTINIKYNNQVVCTKK